MQRFAADPTCTARVLSADRRAWTAIGMQRHILRQIEAHLGHTVMPPWAPQACERLRQVLDRLEEGAQGVAKTLDWAIKLSLYREFARRQGICWESLPKWNRLQRVLENVPLARGDGNAGLSLDEELLNPNGPVQLDVDRLAWVLQQEGLALDELKAVLALRRRLFDLDTRFAQLGPQGLFAALDQAGAGARRAGRR